MASTDHSSLRDFRSEIWNFLSQRLMVKPSVGSLSLEWFQACLELVSISNGAFAKLLLEVNYPVRQWGGEAIDEYLSYTLNLMDLLNAVTASVAPLNQDWISISHALSLMETKTLRLTDSDMAKFLVKYPGGDYTGVFQLKVSAGAVAIPCSDDQKEAVIRQALMVMKRLDFLALGLAVSGLCGADKPYMEVRKFLGEMDDDTMVRVLDLRFCKEMRGIQGGLEEVNAVNRAAEGLSMARLSASRCGDLVKELKGRLETLKTLIHGIEKQASDLFSQVLAARDELLDSLRLHANNTF